MVTKIEIIKGRETKYPRTVRTFLLDSNKRPKNAIETFTTDTREMAIVEDHPSGFSTITKTHIEKTNSGLRQGSKPIVLKEGEVHVMGVDFLGKAEAVVTQVAPITPATKNASSPSSL